MARQSKINWEDARIKWESSKQEGFDWLAIALDGVISRQAISKKAKIDGWCKSGSKAAVKVAQPKNESYATNKKVAQPTAQPKPKLAAKERIMSMLPCEDGPKWVEVAEEKKRGKGRPTLYREGFAQIAHKICLLGATLEKLANLLGVNVDTIYQWRDKYPDFSEALKQGREIADAEVAYSLFKRATGYTVKETRVSLFEGGFITVDVDKNYPPDTAACKLWLYNREPELWKDKRETPVTHVLDKDLLDNIKNVYIERLAKAREIQRQVLIDRGIIDENGVYHGQMGYRPTSG